MPITIAGRDEIVKCLIGEGKNFNASNARIAVGNSNVAFSASQTNLVGTQVRKNMDSGYPSRTTNVVTFKATYSGNEANFPWQEWGITNNASGDTLLNRVVEYNGTKIPGQTWIFEVTLTFNI